MKTLTHRIMQCLVPAPLRSASTHGTQRPARRLRQRGFALGQALVATAVLGGISAVGTDWSTQQRQTAVLEAQSATYARINNGVGVYMTLYYPQIIDRTSYPDDCATLSFNTTGVSSRIGNQCQFTPSYTDAATGVVKTDYVVNNILQPTVADLQHLGLVDKQIPAGPLLPVKPTVGTGPAVAGVTPTANIYGIVIKRVSAGTDVNLDSLVFNVQPYTLASSDLSALLRMSNGSGASSGVEDRNAAGVTTGTSAINPGFDLKAYAGAWSAPNPVQKTTSGNATTGIPGILAWRNTYDATATLQLTRRDGSLKPTADWDFNNKSITNINQVQAQNVTTGTLTVNGQSTLADVNVGGAMNVSGVLTALGKLVVSGSTDLQGLLVHGPATFEEAATFQKNVRVNRDLTVDGTVTGNVHAWNINVENGAQLGAGGTRLLANGGWATQSSPCTVNNALAQDANGRLLVCSSGNWQQATNNVYGLTQVNENDYCPTEGAAAYLPNGLMAICRNHKWTPASMGSQSVNQPCSIEGMMAAEITGDGTTNLLVCRANSSGSRVWSREIYARPKATTAYVDTPCNTDEINAIARNAASDQSGTLMCTANSSGGPTWQQPFYTLGEDSIDYNEYLVMDVVWQDWFNAVLLSNPYWGQVLLAPDGATNLRLRHVKNNVELRSWRNGVNLAGYYNNYLYFRAGSSGPAETRYSEDYATSTVNYSRAQFQFQPGEIDTADWTYPKWVVPGSCIGCNNPDDATQTQIDRGEALRWVEFLPSRLDFKFFNEYNQAGGNGYHQYRLIAYKINHRKYVLVK